MDRIACPVVELRQYTMQPGRRDDLISLFDREFVETQEDCGVTVIGQFRDLDRPDHYVWLRGFDSLATRKRAMETFYPGPVWQTHRVAANATMIDSDDVLLLRPLGADGGFDLGERAPVDAEGSAPGVVVIGVRRLSGPDDVAQGGQGDIRAAAAEAGLPLHTVLVTDPTPNDVPWLPTREGEWVEVWVSRQPDPATADAALDRARADPRLRALFDQMLQTLRLTPTARSRLHG